jgi:hypothetical protein
MAPALEPMRVWCRFADPRNASVSAGGAQNSISAFATEAVRYLFEDCVYTLEALIQASEAFDDRPEHPDQEYPEDANCGEENRWENGRVQGCILTENI